MDSKFVSLVAMAIVIAISVIVTVFRHELANVRFSFFRANPLAKLEALLPELGLELRDRLTSVQFLMSHHWRNDGVLAIVPFFVATSPWYDRLGELWTIHRDLIRCDRDQQFNTVALNLEELCKLLKSAGRNCSVGMNRTWSGQEAAEDNVFLGEIFGFPRPIWFWKKHRNEPKSYFLPGVQKMNPYDVVSVEARDFINVHAAKIIKAVDELEAACLNRQAARESVVHIR